MSELSIIEYEDTGIWTAKETWYTEEVARREKRQTIEYAKEVSQVVEEARRREALAQALADQFRSAVLAERAKQTEAEKALEAKFRKLAEEWYVETMPLSSYLEKILHPSYQRILTLGPKVVPLIMAELRDMPNDWFWALRVLTEVDPVEAGEAGNMRAMANAWLRWWEQDGLSWRQENHV
jgi:hypothetical protein